MSRVFAGCSLVLLFALGCGELFDDLSFGKRAGVGATGGGAGDSGESGSSGNDTTGGSGAAPSGGSGSGTSPTGGGAGDGDDDSTGGGGRANGGASAGGSDSGGTGRTTGGMGGSPNGGASGVSGGGSPNGGASGVSGGGVSGGGSPAAGVSGGGKGGFSGSDPVPGGTAGTPGGAGTSGGGVRPCDRDADFLGPTRLPINQAFSIPWALHLTSDELTLVFTSVGQLYQSTRNDLSQDFTSATPLSTLNSADDDWTVSLSGDGLDVFFDTTRAVAPSFKIYRASRTARTDSFVNVMRDTILNINAATTSDGHPYLLPNSLVLYMVSTRNGSFDLFRAVRSSRTSQFISVAPLTTLNTTSREYFPVVTPDELTLYFASDRTDLPNQGGLDIFVARRENTQMSFGTPENVAELNTPEDEYPNWISEDGCRLYLHTRTPTIAAYIAQKPP